DPVPRRQRLHQRLRHRAPVARRQALRDRRRHQRDKTDADRAGAVRGDGLAWSKAKPSYTRVWRKGIPMARWFAALLLCGAVSASVAQGEANEGVAILPTR